MECNHPEAFVSIKNGHRVCGLCGEVVPEKKQEEKKAPKKSKKSTH